MMLLNFNMLRKNLGIFLKCRFQLNRSGVGLRFCISNQHEGDSDAVDLRTTLISKHLD